MCIRDSTLSSTFSHSALTSSALLVLLANAGPRFWRRLQIESAKNLSNPVDTFSVEKAREFQHTFLRDSRFTQLYPTPAGQSPIPLMRLGRLAGWNIPSPLGLGLHPDYGPWSAYRAAWLTDSAQLPEAFYKEPQTVNITTIDTLQQSAELCVSCTAPCVEACPADAVTHGEDFNIPRCYDYSEPEDSPCHAHCFARTACPIGADHQYDKAQLTHHMIMRWRT